MDIGAMAKNEKMNLESLARRERYAFLEIIREKYTAKYILTAHHAVDQTETVIGNMIKWAKVRGLSGMSYISGNIFRPLLSVAKQEIMKYSKENHIEYREDSSNRDMAYDRNRIRHDIIPVLEWLNPSIHATVSELAEYMQNLSGFLSWKVASWFQDAEWESGKKDSFLIEKLEFIGLNTSETNDFIQYWLPVLEKNKWNFIHFYVNSEYEMISKNTIDPKPETSIRLFMEFYGVEKSINIPEQKLVKTERKGFTLVEWGGSDVGNSINELKN